MVTVGVVGAMASLPCQRRGELRLMCITAWRRVAARHAMSPTSSLTSADRQPPSSSWASVLLHQISASWLQGVCSTHHPPPPAFGYERRSCHRLGACA
jgi:hypothetical protein